MAVDAVLAAAVDVAWEAAVEAAGDANAVGDHLSAHDEGDKLVTHLFACRLPGYRGWVWSVTLSRTPRLKTANVCEAHLVPADDALLAPQWIPWADRVQPGDLEPSMVLPRNDEDARLMPGYEQTGDVDADALAIWELGLGRERVLAPRGREEAADRWYRGSRGPTAPSAIASSAPCSTCAFFIPLTGSLRTTFGACSNEWSPSDGSVVSVDHGCGAHSQTDVERPGTQWPADDPVYIDDATEPFDLSEPEPEGTQQSEPAPEHAPEPERAAEPEPLAEAATEAAAEPDPEPAADAEPAPGSGEDVAADDGADPAEVSLPTDEAALAEDDSADSDRGEGATTAVDPEPTEQGNVAG
ncbi:DUF3027 domain-containing protein [Demequina capsici]|uniref:DUF3027 domain-containing protein n=1 Tax=Demequina capsici TaxID=3075620 RepID=A0AA96JAZ4_9MICO|nr:DUF3027 domain-containing protein [Demequina sp. PMTSA13]WNM27870.1 DUF3027 domain-containing protein [Demequina sp. PMTSA13]